MKSAQEQNSGTVLELLWEFKWYLLGFIVFLMISPFFYGLKGIGMGILSGGNLLLSTSKFFTAKIRSQQ